MCYPKGDNKLQLIPVPSDFSITRSTPFFTEANIPKALLNHHNTAPGVYGQICVMRGAITYYGFANSEEEVPEQEVLIRQGEFIVTPPQYWHRVKLEADAQFNINFWSAESVNKTLNTKR